MIIDISNPETLKMCAVCISETQTAHISNLSDLSISIVIF